MTKTHPSPIKIKEGLIMKKECIKCKHRKIDKEFKYEQIECQLNKCIYDKVENSLNDELEGRVQHKFNGTRWL